jgi:hypothetical protein
MKFNRRSFRLMVAHLLIVALSTLALATAANAAPSTVTQNGVTVTITRSGGDVVAAAKTTQAAGARLDIAIWNEADSTRLGFCKVEPYPGPGTYTCRATTTADTVRVRVKRNGVVLFWAMLTAGGTTPEPTPTPTPTPEPTPTDPPPTTSGFRPYSADSFFKDRLSAGAPVDSQSAAGISFVQNHPDQNLDYPIIRGLGGNKWGTVYFEGGCSDPVWKLTGSVPSETSHLASQGFHAPTKLGEVLTGTSDSPFVVMDRCGNAMMPNGLSMWAAKARKGTGNTIQVGAAGAFQHDSNGLDKRNPRSDSTKNFRSRGAIPDAMVIRKDLVEQAVATGGDLGHVLQMFWVETRTSDGFVHPMVGTESSKNGWGPEGIRIRIKPSVNVEDRPLTPCGKVIARTLQNYGAYLGDNSGSLTSLKVEQDHGQWGTLCNAHALKGLVWTDFEFAQRGHQ